MKPAEIAGINKDFEEAGHLAPTGLFLGGEKYMVVQGEAGAVIRGKKVTFFIREDSFFVVLIEIMNQRISLLDQQVKVHAYFLQGPGGVTIKKTTQALVFGIYDEPMTGGQCNLVVERLGDYLIESGL